ncbi:DUF2829 domain-containing protein [Streptomyces sp. 5-10]|uniref:DUF2829 domain-containing protein n=1 Tax=Streptomyces sp. 5-10 TaxID=878925 RepID=UPI00168A6458|nr:DUF2829 domain-containing protein [Streptomyces sp. 5-10]MBD3004518.1 DUF2829 domain-containing protein [Streptomyces sp. 5-10]
MDLMDYSDALHICRHSRQRISRTGWNGKGQYVVYQEGYPEGIPINKNTSDATGIPEGTVVKFLPYLMFHTSDGAFVPWIASQTDMLGTDWFVLDGD